MHSVFNALSTQFYSPSTFTFRGLNRLIHRFGPTVYIFIF